MDSVDVVDFNECTLGFHDCHAQADCVNKENHFECVCREGWRALGVQREWANGRQCFGELNTYAESETNMLKMH